MIQGFYLPRIVATGDMVRLQALAKCIERMSFFRCRLAAADVRWLVGVQLGVGLFEPDGETIHDWTNLAGGYTTDPAMLPSGIMASVMAKGKRACLRTDA